MGLPEIVAQMNDQARKIAIQRHQAWWDSLSAAEKKQQMGKMGSYGQFRPGVIELQEKATPYALQLNLMMHDIFVSLDDLAKRSQEERDEAMLWSMTAQLEAADNDVIIAPRPEWLPGSDASGWDHGGRRCVDLVHEDLEQYGGEEQARLHFDEAFGREEDDDDVPDDADAFGDVWVPPETRLRDIVRDLREGSPETFATDAEWLEQWLDQGAPMIQPANTSTIAQADYEIVDDRVDAHDRADTSVDAQSSSTEQHHGNAARTDDFPAGFDDSIDGKPIDGDLDRRR